MSLRVDSFERILAFSKLEEVMNMDKETTRWLSVLESMLYSQVFLFFRYLKKKLENGKRNGLQLTGDELEEFKLVKKKISELGIAFLLCLKSSS